ncbi:hypothetical protein GGF32_001114 [Allomyces javanicus]|nr:hypothetical protein GGF32_001114 [Allomyces javanicus]
MFAFHVRVAPSARMAARRMYSSASGSSKPVVGFIGLGQMGRPMASNLFNKTAANRAGFVVFDVFDGAVADFTKTHDGAVRASSPADVAAQADVVITMLPSSPHVASVYEQMAPAVRKGALLIDSSTIDPATARRVAKSVLDKVDAVDAPVSGGVGGATAGTLTFMVGGTKPAFDRANPWLQAMGKSIVHCGDNGNGQVAKICNNMLLGSTMAAAAETMNLGIKMGMDPKLLAQIINTSSGRCWSTDTYNPVPGVMANVPSSRDFEGGFAVPLMQKDMGLALSAAQDVKASVPMAAAADQLYKNILATPGLEKKDFSVVYEWLSGLFVRFVRKP